MRKMILGALSLLCLASCAYRVYPVSALEENYKLTMQTAEEQAAQEHIAIYLSENEVPGPYKLLAFVENRPILPVAIASQQLKNFYKQAVLKADELGGNAIIVNSIRSFKVIQVSGRPLQKKASSGLTPAPQTRPEPRPRLTPAPKESTTVEKSTGKEQTTPFFRKREKPARETVATETVQPAPAPAPKKETPAASQPKKEPATVAVTPTAAPDNADSPVFDETTVEWFTSGYVYRAKEQEQTEIIDAMNSEIRDNLRICKTQEEAACISKKIDLLEKYNQALPIPSGTQAGKIKAYRNSLKKISAKIAEAQPANGFVDGAVQSVKGFFDKLKK